MNCPGCGNDLSGGSIYEHFLEKYGGNKEKALETAALYGATAEEGDFGRQIGIYSMELDRTTHWRCPDCGHEWKR